MELKFMNAAIKEAIKAEKEDEVPIGAVVVMDGKIVARAHNRMEKTHFLPLESFFHHLSISY